MREELPLTYVIILNWNGWLDTVECLQSLQKVTYPRYRIIVLDNGSTDDSVHQLEAWALSNGVSFSTVSVQELEETGEDIGESAFDQRVIFVRSSRNLGFAKGNNVVLRYALRDGEYFILLNNDTVVEKGFIERLVGVAEGDPSIGLVGGRINVYSAPGKVWYSRGYLDLYRGGARSCQDEFEGERQCSYIPGCLMLVRRSFLDDVGLLDERFFFGADDWDYSYRAVTAGWKLVVTSDARILHKVSKSSGGEYSYIGVYYPTASRLQFILTLPIQYKLVAMAYFLLTRVGRSAIWFVSGRRDLVAATARALIDGIRGVIRDAR